jgi:hypothetical protein
VGPNTTRMRDELDPLSRREGAPRDLLDGAEQALRPPHARAAWAVFSAWLADAVFALVRTRVPQSEWLANQQEADAVVTSANLEEVLGGRRRVSDQERHALTRGWLADKAHFSSR